MGDEPILWGLLGNTAANFEDDFELIERLARLLRPQDRLMLEVATTSELAADVSERSSTEYLRSKAFCEFVTSALHQHTDLPINMDYVEISAWAVRGKPYRFGLRLLLLAKDGDTGPGRSAARDLFRDV